MISEQSSLYEAIRARNAEGAVESVRRVVHLMDVATFCEEQDYAAEIRAFVARLDTRLDSVTELDIGTDGWWGVLVLHSTHVKGELRLRMYYTKVRGRGNAFLEAHLENSWYDLATLQPVTDTPLLAAARNAAVVPTPPLMSVRRSLCVALLMLVGVAMLAGLPLWIAALLAGVVMAGGFLSHSFSG